MRPTSVTRLSPSPRTLVYALALALVFALCSPLASQPAQAQPPQATQVAQDFGPKAQADNACLNQVSKFEQAIAFVRDAQGKDAAARLKETLLPAKLESDILFTEGYCGLAKHLRDKRLL